LLLAFLLKGIVVGVVIAVPVGPELEELELCAAPCA